MLWLKVAEKGTADVVIRRNIWWQHLQSDVLHQECVLGRCDAACVSRDGHRLQVVQWHD